MKGAHPIGLLAFSLGLLMVALPCRAQQLGASVSLVSDYRFRGASLNQGAPAVQVGLNVDAASGLFGGLFASRASLRYTSVNAVAVAYAGYARRLDDTFSAEAGATRYAFRGGGKYDYSELFAGLAGGRSSARLYLAARNFGVGGRTLYAEFNTSHPLTERVALVAHAGYLHAFAREYGYQFRQPARSDVRLGVAAAMDGWNAQLAWVAAPHAAPLYRGAGGVAGHAMVLSVARAF